MRQIKVDRQWVFYTMMIQSFTPSIPQLADSLYLDDPANQALFIRSYLQPQFDRPTNPADVRAQYSMKESLRYCLNVYDEAMDVDFRKVWNLYIEWTVAPTDRYGFLRQAWDLLFPDEPWEMDELTLGWYTEVRNQ